MIPVLELPLANAGDVSFARGRAFRLASKLDLSPPDKTRVAVVAGELAQRGFETKPATLTLGIDRDDLWLQLRVPGGIDFDEELLGASQLLDDAAHEQDTLVLKTKLPNPPVLTDAYVAALRIELLASDPGDAPASVKRQNRELVLALAEQEASAAALRASEERLKLAVRAAGLGSWELDEDELILSQRAAKLLDVQGDVTLDMLAAKLGPRGAELLEALELLQASGEPLHVEFKMPSGRWLAFHGARLTNKRKKRRRITGAVLDVTEHREREEEMRKRLDFERQLVGIVSHDLKSPLTAISMGASMLEGADDFVVDRIKHSVKRAQQLIYDLLDFTHARLGSGIPISPQRTDIAQVVATTVEQMQFAHPDHTFELLPYGAVFAMADEPRLEQVVTNLLANAVEYGDSKRPIVVRCFEEDGLAIVSVRNEGEPIDQDRVHTIFEPLERDEPAESGSLGLGLFIVDQLVRAHEGEVEVHSGEDGTEFQVRLPLAAGA